MPSRIEDYALIGGRRRPLLPAMGRATGSAFRASTWALASRRCSAPRSMAAGRSRRPSQDLEDRLVRMGLAERTEVRGAQVRLSVYALTREQERRAEPDERLSGAAPGDHLRVGHVAGKAFGVALLWAIVLSIIIVLLESVSRLRLRYGEELRAAEWIFTGLFTIEYVLHSLLVVRVLRLLRVFRVLKLGGFLGQAELLMSAIRASRPKITVFLGAVLSIVVITGAVMYLIRRVARSLLKAAPSRTKVTGAVVANRIHFFAGTFLR